MVELKQKVRVTKNTKISYFSKVNRTKPIKDTTIRGVLRRIKEGKWKEEVEKVRAVEGKNQRNELKKKLLPAVTISGTFTERKNNKLINHSGFICIDQSAGDLDNEEIKQRLKKDKYTHSVFYSASGKDLAIIVKVKPKKHDQAFEGLKAYYKRKYGFEIDNCQDVSRARYVSYDPELIYKPKSAVFKKYPKKKKTRASLPAKKQPPEILENQVKYITKQIVKKGINLTGEKDTYDDWILVGFSLVDGLGEKGRKYFHQISKVSGKYTEEGADKQYDHCLESHKNRVGKDKITIGYLISLAKDADIKVHRGLKNERCYSKSGKCRFEPLLEARIFQEEGNKRFIIHAKELLMYYDGYYKPFNKEYYLKLLEEQIEYVHDGRVHKAVEILKGLEHQHYHKTDLKVNNNPKLLNVKNGLLDIDTMELQPHTPDLIYTYQIPVKYNPDAKCRRWKQFLKEVLVKKNNMEPDNQLKKIAKRYVGYCMHTGIIHQRALILYGKGSNGKSVFCDVVEALIGKEQTSNVDFGKIGRNTFASSRLIGKLLNICVDFAGIQSLGDTDTKAIISGDPIDVERKGQDGFKYKPQAKHIVCINELPYTKDKTYGFFRRWDILPFNAQFKSKVEMKNIEEDEKLVCREKELRLQEKIINEELQGVLLWAVDGLKRLLDEGEFPHSKQVVEMKKAFRVRSSSLDIFVEEKLEKIESDDYEETEERVKNVWLFEKYCEFCKKYKVPSLGIRKFGEGIESKGFERIKGKNNVLYVHYVKYLED